MPAEAPGGVVRSGLEADSEHPGALGQNWGGVMTRRVRDGERVMPGDTGRSVRTDLEGCSLLRPGAPPSDSAAGLGPPVMRGQEGLSSCSLENSL